ncbi:MAG: CVNH domain-containing protein [Bradymonadia bacterium]
MRGLIKYVSLLWLSLAGCLLPAAANAGLPVGSYSDSCRQCTVTQNGSGEMLRCQCRSRKGRWQSSHLNLRWCNNQRDTYNRDGELGCAAPAARTTTPRGNSYLVTCNACWVRFDGQLQCRCRKRGGGRRTTEISLKSCSGKPDLMNDNGHLRCPSPKKQSWPYQGSYRQSCRACEKVNGNALRCECRRRNGQWKQSTLFMSACKDKKANNNDGTLTCNIDTYWSQRLGSARMQSERADMRQLQRCRKCTLSGPNGTLKCECRWPTGSAYYHSQLNMKFCKKGSIRVVREGAAAKLQCTSTSKVRAGTNRKTRSPGRFRR